MALYLHYVRQWSRSHWCGLWRAMIPPLVTALITNASNVMSFFRVKVYQEPLTSNSSIFTFSVKGMSQKSTLSFSAICLFFF